VISVHSTPYLQVLVDRGVVRWTPQGGGGGKSRQGAGSEGEGDGWGCLSAQGKFRGKGITSGGVDHEVGFLDMEG